MGGGPVITICLQIFFKLDIKTAVKYTYLLMFGGGIASSIVNFWKKDREGFPLVNYELVLLTLPTIVAGSLLGVYINNILPEACILGLMIMFLAFISHRTYRKI